MNREIKFRAYGEIQCYYLTSSGWKPKKQMCQVSSLNIKTQKCRVLYKGENGTNEYDTFELSKVNLMQYTGLHDKNGKEIYEGDVFNIDNINYVVKWHEDVCRYILTTGKGYDSRNCIDLTCDVIYYAKIIGNIYENPELLKN